MHFGVGTLKINQSLEALFTFCFYINNCLTYVCLADKHQTACARWPLSNVNILLIEAILSQGIFYFRKTFYVDGIEANSNCLCGGRLDYSATQPPICHRSCWAWRIFIRKNNSRRHVQLFRSTFRIKTKIAKLGDGDSANVTHKHTHTEKTIFGVNTLKIFRRRRRRRCRRKKLFLKFAETKDERNEGPDGDEYW